MKYVLSKSAQADLIHIWEYTFENWSLIQADNYYRILIDRIVELTKYPELGKDYSFARKGYRGLIVKSHIIFYKETKTEIVIIRILHQSVDINNLL